MNNNRPYSKIAEYNLQFYKNKDHMFKEYYKIKRKEKYTSSEQMKLASIFMYASTLFHNYRVVFYTEEFSFPLEMLLPQNYTDKDIQDFISWSNYTVTRWEIK